MQVTLSIQRATDCIKDLPSRQACLRWIKSAFQVLQNTSHIPALSCQHIEITLRFVDAPESAALNQQYRHKVGATNILSFSCPYVAEEAIYYLGDLVICVPLVLQEAEEQGKSSIAHWAHLILHGVLHLLGYDHIRKKDAAIMEQLEITALAQLGYDDPYV